MSVHYLVQTDYALPKGKPSLTNISIYSTSSASNSVPFHLSENSLLKTGRILPAHEIIFFISHLHKIYNQEPFPLPVLDCGQKELFSEVQP